MDTAWKKTLLQMLDLHPFVNPETQKWLQLLSLKQEAAEYLKPAHHVKLMVACIFLLHLWPVCFIISYSSVVIKKFNSTYNFVRVVSEITFKPCFVTKINSQSKQVCFTNNQHRILSRTTNQGSSKSIQPRELDSNSIK